MCIVFSSASLLSYQKRYGIRIENVKYASAIGAAAAAAAGYTRRHRRRSASSLSFR